MPKKKADDNRIHYLLHDHALVQSQVKLASSQQDVGAHRHPDDARLISVVVKPLARTI